MLDVESRGSQSLLNVESFRNPDQYKLRVERNGETQLVNVDLVETFNWLLGLTVKHIDVIRGVRVVEGTNPDGDRVWCSGETSTRWTTTPWTSGSRSRTTTLRTGLRPVLRQRRQQPRKSPPSDQTWKVRLIEEEFGRLMFDVQDV